MTQPNAIESDTGATRVRSTGLIDVKIAKPSELQVSVVVMWAMGLFIVLLLVFAIFGVLNAIVAFLTLAAVTVLGIIGAVFVSDRNRRRAFRESRSLMEQGKVEAAVTRLAERIGIDGPNYVMVKEFKNLARVHTPPLAIRFHSSDSIGEVVPLDVSFTPVSLDESDAQFVQLVEATTEQEENPTRGTAALRITAAEASIGRRVRRRMRLVWIWPCLIAALLQIASQVIGSYQRQSRIASLLLLIATFFLALNFFATSAFPAAVPLKHFIVPGGLLLRRKAKGTTKSDLELLSPKTAILVAVQTRKQAWTVFITDGNRNEPLLLTALETEMLLRAWLSPIPPPSVDKLIDLT